LDAHFTIEQVGRNTGGHFINFNGTAGIWRKKTIEEAGGWSADTLTEDLDLSYRAQLKGWKFQYLENLASPAELPLEMNALKAQQRRWTKGAAECTRKHLWNVWQAKNLLVSTKIHALFHLMNSAAFLCMLALSLMSVPIQTIANRYPSYAIFFQLTNIFQLCLVILGVFYWVSYRKNGNFGGFLVKFPLFLAFMMGLSLHNSLAVLEGYLGKKTPFVRTPKFNLAHQSEHWTTNKYLSERISSLTIIEFGLMIFFGWACWRDLNWTDYQLLIFHLLFTFGFGSVSLYSIFHKLIRR
jgi:cellulose synthase/poly-beta-1,6-N-acetylglucosamine synthase-like glycosyltransferase